MNPSALTLVEVLPHKKRTYWYVFESSDRFVKPWWDREFAVSASDHWLSARSDDTEVARCKFVLYPGPLSHRVLGEMPHGQLDILALEVAVPERGRGVGRETLQAIRREYPMPRLTALNDDNRSRGFWDRMGWIRHEPAGILRGSERVTYSETGNMPSVPSH